MSLRRPFSSDKPDAPKPASGDSNHSHSHSHSSPSIFGHSHSHSHDHAGHSHGSPDQLVNAFRNLDDRGSRVTLIGLGANVVLTASKGAAGVVMNSAALVAEAGHSLSDLLGDFVTLFSWKLSREPPSERWPYGRGKFEALGSTTVSLLLIGGAVGIGFHSAHLLSDALATTAATMPAGPLQTAIHNVTLAASHLPDVGHSHGHESAVLDPNAAWFAAVSVIAKEWLYRITKKVADDENSPVLLANAIHHRSDAYSSVVALVAILGTWLYPTIPLDPIGGIVVAFVILQQGIAILRRSYRDLTDASVHPAKLQTLQGHLDTLEIGANIHSFSRLRARSAGATMFVDVTAEVEGILTVSEACTLEEKIRRTLKTAESGIAEVNVRFKPVSKS